MSAKTSAALGRLFRETPRVSQSDVLQLLGELVDTTPKDHGKMFKAESKTLSTQAQQSKLDVNTCRLERLGVSPCKTTIETLTLTNSRKTPVSWKIARPCQVTSQHFLSCTPASGTLEKGKTVEVRVCCVLFTRHHSVLDLLSITCTSSGSASSSYLPILLHVTPNPNATHEPYWSVDLAELTLISATSDSTLAHHTQASTSNNPILTPSPINFNTLHGLAQSPGPSTAHLLGGSPDSTGSSLGKRVSAAERVSGAEPETLPRSLTPPTAASMPSTPLSSSPSSVSSLVAPTASVVTVMTASAYLYGTKVFLRRWNIGEHSMPPPECVDEISALQRLYHSHLASFIGARAQKGQAYVITKFMEGGAFSKFLKASIAAAPLTSGPSPSAYTSTMPSLATNAPGPKLDANALMKRLEMMLDVAYAMAFLHGRGIVHRHLSTSNMLLDENRRIRLCEAGTEGSHHAQLSGAINVYLAPELLGDGQDNSAPPPTLGTYLAIRSAALSDAKDPSSASINSASQNLATPKDASSSSMSPSSNDDSGLSSNVEHLVLMASDVFAFGICLWEAIIGAKPVRSAMDLVSGYVPSLPADMAMFPDLVELVNSCLQRDPLSRPSFSAVIGELAAVIESAPKRTPFHFAMPRNKTIKDDLISSFPTTLVFLDLASNVHLTDSCALSMPKSLVHLDLSMITNFTDDAIAYLPPMLTHLDLSAATRLTDGAIPLMPRGLQFLSLRDNTNLTEKCLAGLPTSLITLNLLNASKLLPESALSQFPSSLTDFTVPFGWITTFKDELIPKLPPALRTLNFATNTSLTAAGIANLPPKMKHINLASNPHITKEALTLLSTGLESLNLASATALTDDDMQHLPRALAHLNLSRNKTVGVAGLKSLPPNLISLTLSSTPNILDIGIRSLPRSLTTLILSGNKQLTDEAIKDLPPSLTEFNLAANSKLTDGCAGAFPASLKILNLFANLHFTDASIRALPRSLTELNLGSNEMFTDACLPDLPRSLRVLYLRKSTMFSDDGIQYLPRSLTHLDLSAARNLTDECVCDMPIGLVTLELWKNQNLTKDNLKARLPLIRVLALNVE